MLKPEIAAFIACFTMFSCYLREGLIVISDSYDKTEAYKDIVREAGNVVEAKEAVTLIDKKHDKELAYQDIAATQAKAGDVAGAKKTASLISNNNAKANAYTTIAEAQAEAGDLVGAVESIAEGAKIMQEAMQEKQKK